VWKASRSGFDAVRHGFSASRKTKAKLVGAGEGRSTSRGGVKDAASGQFGRGFKECDGSDAFEVGFVEGSNPAIKKDSSNARGDGVGSPKIGPGEESCGTRFAAHGEFDVCVA